MGYERLAAGRVGEDMKRTWLPVSTGRHEGDKRLCSVPDCPEVPAGKWSISCKNHRSTERWICSGGGHSIKECPVRSGVHAHGPGEPCNDNCALGFPQPSINTIHEVGTLAVVDQNASNWIKKWRAPLPLHLRGGAGTGLCFKHGIPMQGWNCSKCAGVGMIKSRYLDRHSRRHVE
jgi:hypothetical protein